MSDDKELLELILLKGCESNIEILIHILCNVEDDDLSKKGNILLLKMQNSHIKHQINHEIWLNDYLDTEFYKLFRMKQETFKALLRTLLENDVHMLIRKTYRGGRYPITPEKGLLVFLWFMSKQDSLIAIADRFGVATVTVFRLVNEFLYVLLQLKNKVIIWPSTQEEFDHLTNSFKKYPGVIGALDGSQISIKVPNDQQDSYINRYQQHSINLMAICTADRVFTYTFIGFPGSAHDSRVFSNSLLCEDVERNGANKYFKDSKKYHLIADSAFPLREWLITPYKEIGQLTRRQRQHNYLLSSDRVCIENAFGILKGRWQRLLFINTYSISKAVEIVTAACILHNFCILNVDSWTGEIEVQENEEDLRYNHEERRAQQAGSAKRDAICSQL